MWLFVPHLGLGFCLPVLQWRGRGFTNLSQPFLLTPIRNGSVFVGVVHSTKWRRRNTGSQCYLCWSLCFSISAGRYDNREGWQVTPLEIFLCYSQVLSKVQFDLTAATLCNRWFMMTLALVTSLTLLLWLVLSPDMFPLLLMVFQIIKLVFCTFVMTEISLPLKKTMLLSVYPFFLFSFQSIIYRQVKFTPDYQHLWLPHQFMMRWTGDQSMTSQGVSARCGRSLGGNGLGCSRSAAAVWRARCTWNSASVGEWFRPVVMTGGITGS